MIVSDNGTEFGNGPVQEFDQSHKISVHYTTTENAQSNGMSENFHSTIFPNSIHSTIKQNSIEVLNGHLNNHGPIDITRTLLYYYTQKHREKKKLMNKELNLRAIETNKHVIEKLNMRRHKPISFNQKQRCIRKLSRKEINCSSQLPQIQFNHKIT